MLKKKAPKKMQRAHRANNSWHKGGKRDKGGRQVAGKGTKRFLHACEYAYTYIYTCIHTYTHTREYKYTVSGKKYAPTSITSTNK